MNSKNLLTACCIVCFSFCTGYAQDEDGNWDDRFLINGIKGIDYSVWAVAVDRNKDDLYVGGDIAIAGSIRVNYVAKWNGSTWSSVGDELGDHVLKLLVRPNGNLVAGGEFAVRPKGIAKWDGSTWSTLDDGLMHNVNALAVDNNGNLFAGGWFVKTAREITVNHVAKWDGSEWTALGPGVPGDVEDLVVDESDNLYAAGGVRTAGGWGVAKWDGNTWSPLGDGVNARALVFDGMGNLYAGGNGVWKWDGNDWIMLGGGLQTVLDLVIDDAGILYAGGTFTETIDGSVSGLNRVAKWTGSVWSPLGSGLNGAAVALAIDEHSLWVGGDFTAAGGKPSLHIARYSLSSHPALPHDFLFLATDYLKRGRGISEGDIHCNGQLEFNKGNRGITDHTGNVTAVGKIKIRNRNKIDGDVIAGGDLRLSRKAEVTGMTTENASVAPVPMTLAPFTTNNDDRKVRKSKTLFLPPGAYGAVRLSNDATLELTHNGVTGEYFFERLEFNKNDTLKIDASAGPVTMNVVKLFKMRKNSEMVLLPGGALSSELVTLNYLSTSKMRFDNNVKFFGTIIAPNAQASFGKNTRFRGSICAKQIRTRKGGVFFSHDAITPLPPAPASGIEDIDTLTLSTDPDGALLTEFALEGNYPNPFNPSTTIRFALPQASEVKLAIYNVRGQLVRTLVSGAIEAGRHQVVWNGRNASGAQVASGIYLYRFQAQDFVGVRKLLLTK